ncbi:MAG: dodecin [Planctomycetota bacterium]
MADPVFQKMVFVGTSTVSFSEATAAAIAKASQAVKGASWFEVCEQRGSIADGKIHQYQVTVAVGYRVE